ncbi:MAG: hypothetical protein HYZ89_02745 [Candidatus Omnitrophica bacterium]|nr:hypothetical protein [Candidatus Omnitrophota bacterium]
MRQVADADHIRQLMSALGTHAEQETRIYFTGGATAVLIGWRPTTIDVDLQIVPETDPLLQTLPPMKERLSINVELASPADFIPELPGWQDRSVYITREGRISFYHYDLYAQALAKIERGHMQDRDDVQHMLHRGLVEPAQVRRHFDMIEPWLFRYPAIDPPSFRQALDEMLSEATG